MSERKKVLKDASVYSASIYLAQGLQLIRGILVARIVGPAIYGLSKGLDLLLGYGAFSPLGTLNAMEREMPYHLAKGDQKKVRLVLDTTFTFNFFMSLLFSIIVFIASFFLSLSPLIIFGLRITAVTILFQQIYYFYEKYMIASKEFFYKSKIMLLLAVFDIIFIVGLTLLFVAEGLFVGLFLTYFVSVIVLYFTLKPRPRFSFNFKELPVLLKIGFPVFVIVVLATILLSVERIMILKFMGMVFLGYYAIGIMFVNLIRMAVKVVVDVVSPRLFESIGKNDKIIEIKSHVFLPSIASAYIFPLILGIAFLSIPFLITAFLPDYASGLVATRILVLGTFFICINPIGLLFMMAVNKQHKLIMSYVVAILLCISADYILLRMGMGISGVAIGTVCAWIFLAATNFYYIMREYGLGFIPLMKFYLKLLIPFLVLVVSVLFIDMLGINLVIVSSTTYNLLFLTVFRIIIFSLIMLPLLYYANKETGFFSTSWSIFMERVHKILKTKAH